MESPSIISPESILPPEVARFANIILQILQDVPFDIENLETTTSSLNAIISFNTPITKEFLELQELIAHEYEKFHDVTYEVYQSNADDDRIIITVSSKRLH